MTNRWAEWLFQRDALAKARELPALSTPSKEQLALAQAAAALADYVATASDPVHDLGKRLTRPAAAELAMCLYRDACRRALSDSVQSGGDFASVIAAAPRATLLGAAGSEQALQALESSLLAAGDPRIDRLEPADRQRALRLSGTFVRALLRPLEAAVDPVGRVRQRRRMHWLIGCAVLIALVLLVRFATRKPNYAETAAWTTSSGFNGTPTHGVGFEPLSIAPVFFHTNPQTDPWLEFDLVHERSISAITVDNRADCCGDRAAPLVLEVSLDHTHYTSVAECHDTFLSCTRAFPATQARYVRLHVPRQTSLHLEHVEIH
jgi:hypothetical protein